MKRKNIKDTTGIQSVISEKLVEIYEAGEENITELKYSRRWHYLLFYS